MLNKFIAIIIIAIVITIIVEWLITCYYNYFCASPTRLRGLTVQRPHLFLTSVYAV